jgi:integrase
MAEASKTRRRRGPYWVEKLERGLTEETHVAAGTRRYCLRLQTSEGRKEVTLKATNRAAARTEAATLRAAVASKTYVQPTSMTFADLLISWKEEKASLVAAGEFSPRTVENVEGALRKWAKPISARKATDITRAHVLSIRDDVRREGRSSERQDSVIDAISSVLQHGCDRELLPRNVARGIPKRLRTKVKPLRTPYVPSTEEIESILTAAPAEWRVYLTTLADLGCRDGEARGLRWGSLDLDANVVNITAQLSRDGLESIRLKTDGSRRAVPLPPRLRGLLVGHKLASRHTGDDDLIFCDRDGHGFLYINTLRALGRAVTKAGIKKADDQRLALHCLRHSWASRLLAAGVDIVRVSKWLGHARVSMTLDTYGHAIPSKDSDDSDVIGRALAGRAS